MIRKMKIIRHLGEMVGLAIKASILASLKISRDLSLAGNKKEVLMITMKKMRQNKKRLNKMMSRSMTKILKRWKESKTEKSSI